MIFLKTICGLTCWLAFSPCFRRPRSCSFHKIIMDYASSSCSSECTKDPCSSYYVGDDGGLDDSSTDRKKNPLVPPLNHEPKRGEEVDDVHPIEPPPLVPPTGSNLLPSFQDTTSHHSPPLFFSSPSSTDFLPSSPSSTDFSPTTFRLDVSSPLYSASPLEFLSQLLSHDQARGRVVVLAGAGISVSAGIPDFRSPGTGLYSRLETLMAGQQPESIFDIHYFRQNPKPFTTLAKELFPGNFRPTKTHLFIFLLQQKGLLKRHYTQNIDTLERMAGVEEDKLVEAHGSFAKVFCLDCGHESSLKEYKTRIYQGKIPRCTKKHMVCTTDSTLPDNQDPHDGGGSWNTTTTTTTDDDDSLVSSLASRQQPTPDDDAPPGAAGATFSGASSSSSPPQHLSKGVDDDLADQLQAKLHLHGGTQHGSSNHHHDTDDDDDDDDNNNDSSLPPNNDSSRGGDPTRSPILNDSSPFLYCGGLLKPSITFFGESLSHRFFELSHQDLREARILLILGSSLQVHPFAALPDMCRNRCHRFIINREKPDGFKLRTQHSPTYYPTGGGTSPSDDNSRKDITRRKLQQQQQQQGTRRKRQGIDQFIQGDCDEAVEQLCDLLGWREALELLYAT